MRFILAIIGAVCLLGIGLPAQQVSLPVTPPDPQHNVHPHPDGVESASPSASSPATGLAHSFTINEYISDSGIDPSIVFVPVGRRVQLVLRNMSMAEHHYRVVGLRAGGLLWIAEPGAGLAAMDAPSAEDEDHMHHARDFVPRREPSPAGIRPTGRDVHVYVSAARLVDIVIFTPTQPGTFLVQCDLHHETIGKMIVFDTEDSAPSSQTTHAAPSAHPVADPLILRRLDPLRAELTRDLGSVDHPGASGVHLEAMWAPSEQINEICGDLDPAMQILDPDRYVAVLLTETISDGELPPASMHTPDLYFGEDRLALLDSHVVTWTKDSRITLYRFNRDGEVGRVLRLRLPSGQFASWNLSSPSEPNRLLWFATATCLALLAWLAWTLRQRRDVRSNRLRWARAAALTVLGVVAAWSWLFVVSRWGPEQRTDILTFKSGVTSKVMRALLKAPQGAASAAHAHDAISISSVYATPEYYLMTEQTRDAARYQPEKFNVFYVFEDSHTGDLPPAPPAMTLRLPGGRQLPALDAAVLTQSAHHRATVVRFPSRDAQGGLLIAEPEPFFELVAQESAPGRPGIVQAAMTGGGPLMPAAQVMRWNLPITYPENLQGTDLSLPTLFALMAGLLAVLSPCLLQLTVYYTFALAGIGMQQSSLDHNFAAARSLVLRTAMQFIAGFTIVFTAAGSLAGLAGQRLQLSGFMEQWNRPLGIAAGVGLLIVGVWVGSNAGAPGLCRLPISATLRTRRPWLDRLKVMFMGSAFAVGCSTCFGGALFISLMIYVGAAGSPLLGAFSLFLFSLGIAVPYLLAAYFLSRALPILNSLHRAASAVGLVCSVVLIFFGVILITDTFHIPSNWLYRLYLGL